MTDLRYMTDVLDTVGATSYKINETVTASYELFFVGRATETVRRTETDELSVTVYVDHDGATGASTFAVYPSADASELRAAAEGAIARAALVFDEPYGLPAKTVGSWEVPSDMKEVPADRLAAELAEAVFSADRPDGATVNALEVFIKDITERVVTSGGTDAVQHRRTAELEVIPTFTDETGSVELYEFYSLADADIAALSAKIRARMYDVAARMQATVPAERPACSVLLGAGELRVLFGTLARDLSYAAAYQHSCRFAVGDKLQSAPQGDRLTLHACATVEGSARGAAFDADGVLLTDRTVIRDGVAVARYGSHRFAHYLGEEATGALPCLRVEAGAHPTEALRTGAYLECVYLSGLQVDLFNDYIGGEVRLAYLCDGERRTPVTGISISGRLSEVLDRMQLSEACETVGAYRGPALARFDGFTVF